MMTNRAQHNAVEKQASDGLQGTNSVGGSNAYALAALPGATDSVIVSSANFPNYFSIYDSGVPRGTPVSGYYTQPYAILTDGTKNEVYASGSAGYQVFTYGASGLTQKTSNGTGPGVQSGGDLQIAGGKLYGSNSKIYDPESGALLATLYASGSNVANGSTFADASLNKIFVLDSTSGGFSYYGQNQVQVFSATDYTSVGSIPVSLDTSTYSGGNRLTRWGANGVAFRTPAGFYTLRSSQVKDLSGTTADLAISLTSSGTTTTSPVTFSATIKNNGGSAASNVAFAGFLPSNGKLLGVTTSAGTCYTAGTLTCDLGSLANGAAATVTVSIQPATAGNLVFAASVAGTEPDTVSSNNTASLTAAVIGADYVPAPTVSSLSPAAIKAGASDTTLTINGTGFTSGSVVTLGSATLSAKLVSSAQLTVTVPAANLASMGWLPLTVSNTGTGASAPVALTVFNVVTAGLNHIAYEPFTRKLFASVGSGSATLTGNSIVQLTPESGTFSTPVNIGSQPTRFTITSSGNYLYANLSGSNTLARFNIPTNTTEFAFTPGTPSNYYYGSTATFADLVAQPGSDTVLAVNYYSGGVGLVDVDASSKKGTLRGGTTTSSFSTIYAVDTQFADAGTLYLFDGSLERYPIGTGALSSGTTHTGTYLQYFGPFNISGNYAYADSGGLANLSGSAPVQAGIFKQLGNGIYGQKVVGDAALGKAYFVGSTSSSSSSTDGIIAYDQTTLLPVQSLSLGMASIEGTSSFTVTDVVRWGQDGLAVLTSTGHTYLLRGPAVLPQLLNTASAATLDSSQSASLTHGSANTLLKLTGSNFAPGVVVTWNGDNRSTTFMDANHVTVALPASDLISAGTATLTATNPGAPASATQSITVQ